MDKISAIIIDDEELARSIIKEYLAEHYEIAVVAECKDAHEAYAAIKKYEPDLLFLDIQMPEISGFELLEMIDRIQAIIFSTAYDQYAIKAFDVNTVDYLLKPFDVDRFNLALTRSEKDIRSEKQKTYSIQQLIQSVKISQEYLERLLIKQSVRIIIIYSREIYLIQAMDDYAEICTKSDKYLIQQSLNHLESRLNGDQFVRVHRSYIVNIDVIKDIVVLSNGRHQLYLKNGSEIAASRSGYQKLKKFIL